jgi:hypothetical protein
MKMEFEVNHYLMIFPSENKDEHTQCMITVPNIGIVNPIVERYGISSDLTISWDVYPDTIYKWVDDSWEVVYGKPEGSMKLPMPVGVV